MRYASLELSRASSMSSAGGWMVNSPDLVKDGLMSATEATLSGVD